MRSASRCVTREPKRNKAVYVALGVRPDGSKEILGLWIEQSEGAKVWLRVMNALKSRGVDDVLIAIVDGLKGLDAGASAYAHRTPLRRSFHKPRCRCVSSI